ncbi:hypothetical protein F383_35228 [Gossypium arboreum]|uniref:Uncharacterized protein n=1 Tax=Gossypium arboreum TaxID=29729 RepID=A0A0B0N188_GOSAR|nr:hypothetical protein F383_35228 [Gossypium arboreum]
MTLHTTEVVHSTHQLSIPYLFELRLLLTSKYASQSYIVCHPFKI